MFNFIRIYILSLIAYTLLCKELNLELWYEKGIELRHAIVSLTVSRSEQLNLTQQVHSLWQRRHIGLAALGTPQHLHQIQLVETVAIAVIIDMDAAHHHGCRVQLSRD